MPEMAEIFIDYSLLGVGQRRFQTRVKAATRRQLHTGDTVVVHGDDVPAALAQVLAVTAERPEVELELLGA